ncbi:Panacea domain-containing protein [Streptococcus equi]|uniref:Panacea domain-containing protein n=1 Tax=Streptococcus equi TaxID=1336 RepID=UPI0039C69D17
MFQDKIEKWKFGPVVPKVYHEYKRFGASTITKDDISAQIWKFNFEVSPFGEESPIEVLTYNKEEFSDSQIQLIESTILALKKYSTFKLVDLTHEDDMWKSDNQHHNVW